MQNRPETRLKCAMTNKQNKKHQSSWERMILPHIKELYEHGVIVEQEVMCGRYNCDFYFPLQRLVVEIDGRYAHKERDKPRRLNAILKDVNDVYIVDMERCNEKKAQEVAMMVYNQLLGRSWHGLKVVEVS